MKVKEESEKAGLKFNIQETKVMASRTTTSWQILGKKLELVTDFFSWAPKALWMVTAAMQLKDACSVGKSMTNLDSVLKSRCIPLSAKVHLVKTMILPTVKYGCESWTLKKAEYPRIEAFELG